MTPLKDKTWLFRLDEIDYAYQPIVNIHTGVCFGCEALLRNHEAAGFSSIEEVFNRAFDENVLHQVDLALREKAMAKFSEFRKGKEYKLFYNLDNRLINSKDYEPGNTSDLLEKYNFSKNSICFEISEKHELEYINNAAEVLHTYRSQGFNIAVDDCGVGFSGLQLLYYAEPEYIKIDRFFISGIGNDSKKRLFVSSIVKIAHFMGSLVVAEGVETRQEFFSCRDIGCDLVQGYYVQKPVLEIGQLKVKYDEVELLSKADQRTGFTDDRMLVKSQIKCVESVYIDDDIISIFEKFRTRGDISFFPVLNRQDEPLGVIRENVFKDFAFSRFGRQLLENPAFGKDINKFICKFPVADIHSKVEKLLQIFSLDENVEGLCIVENMKFVGFLSAQSLLKIINEKNLATARDQNPLSKLPGNIVIYEYVSNVLLNINTSYQLVYFDFDNFKAYNDTYGFRNGDRLILLFSELLKSISVSSNRLAGHIGGDDFFMGVEGRPLEKIKSETQDLLLAFKKDAESFYPQDAIERGYIIAKNREGVEGKIPLVTISAVILDLPKNVDRSFSPEEIGNIIAQLKKKAKGSTDKLCISCISKF